MHDHEHTCCDHCLHYCPQCDVVYCCKCKREWGRTYCWPTTYPNWVYPYWTDPYGGNTANGSGYQYTYVGNSKECKHEHNS